MKKLFLIPVLVLAMSFASCNSCNKNQEPAPAEEVIVIEEIDETAMAECCKGEGECTEECAEKCSKECTKEVAE